MPNDDYILRGDALKAILGASIYDTIEELEGARTIAENTWADGLYDAYKIIEEEVDAADVEPKQRWVPVTDADSLPKKSIPCLVACNQWGGDIVRKATYLYSEKIFYENGHDITEYVTHWMPCPEPPKTDAISEIKEIHERFERLLREVVKGAEE